MTISRRRFIAISAAAMGVGMRAQASTWRGVAMGADVSITLHANEADADHILALAISRIRQLENEFSLYLTQSRISALNDTGKSVNTLDFNALLNEANEIYNYTNGLFDPTIQPLWRAYADDPNLPADAQQQALLRVGWQHVENTAKHVRFARAGMAMTLNGIAQGFITDQISALLATHGYDDAIVNIGEYRAGARAAQIAVAGTDDIVTLKNAALATSTPTALMLNGDTTHILHPRYGAIPSVWKTVTVAAKRASIADGVSTALCLTPDLRLAQKLIENGVIQRCLLVDNNGKLTTLAG
ncbi:FAD:protein FMN transferase [Amylibacter ulvae]|uniref:FAD:protein FMN transferase n=1 Tax=Paramylibacter ulvae TaxID=1651968 RepID=A0ABQ3CYM8_9RHOB|nr:FAD:protein FMN transferase [Amylibacter ulvae]GHA42494.1 FAD:protein FMN transferase [Amylibacter ulvae]